MDGKMLLPGERYLFRLKGKQVPVLFEGRVNGWTAAVSSGTFETVVPGNGEPRLKLVRLDDGVILFRKAARALSEHYDSCKAWGVEGICNCDRRLAAAPGELD